MAGVNEGPGTFQEQKRLPIDREYIYKLASLHKKISELSYPWRSCGTGPKGKTILKPYGMK
jgi:hypothetical protein